MGLASRVVLLVLLAAAALSCATSGGYEKVLKSWVGSDISSLIESWGPPSSSYSLPNGRTMYTWDTSGGAVAVPIGNSVAVVPRRCKTTFTVDLSGVVRAWRYEGNMCKV